MKLLIDTDAFCKLAVGGLLRDAVGVLGADITECGRLPALPYMLRRGRLRTVFGPEACDSLIPVANMVPVVVPPTDAWLDKLTPIQAIDPGEAQIFAAGAESGLLVMSGDKRALRALREVAAFTDALSGRIIVLEAIFIALCDRFGPEYVRRRIQVLAATDKMIQVCFSTGNPDPRDGLLSYYRSLAAELNPLVLWQPRYGGGT